MKKEIVCDFAPDGNITIEAMGFTGKMCQKATAFIERAIGRIKSQKLKPEAYKKQVERCQMH